VVSSVASQSLVRAWVHEVTRRDTKRGTAAGQCVGKSRVSRRWRGSGGRLAREMPARGSSTNSVRDPASWRGDRCCGGGRRWAEMGVFLMFVVG